MVVFQGRGRRSRGGSRYKKYRDYKKYELGKLPGLTGIGKKRLQTIKALGNNRKYRLLSIDIASIVDPKTKKSQKAKIKTIKENPANSHFVRRNIMTKGAIIETDIGKARITSRPGQDGVVNAVLIS
jgi:small subunit ribosomal protein S8e